MWKAGERAESTGRCPLIAGDTAHGDGPPPKFHSTLIALLLSFAVAPSVDGIVEKMRAGREVTFNELTKVCDHFFGQARQQRTSHRI
jgi:hypothetical protein